MKFLIHFTWPNGEEDTVLVFADTVEEARKQAEKEVASRGGVDAWSEEVEP